MPIGLVQHGKKKYSDKNGGHINGLEGFWGYLKRKLAAKAGQENTITLVPWGVRMTIQL